MNSNVCLIAALLSISAMPLSADFTYEQQSKVTGGMMAGMMKMAGVFSKSAREPIQTTVIIKGDRMANVSRDHVQVVDLAKETMTDVDMAHKTYSVTTFAEMRQAMANMAEKMSKEKSKQGEDMDMNVTANVKNTGQKKTINGFNAAEKILTLEMAATDKKSGQQGGMEVVMDMWVAPKIAGYDEVMNFHKRMAEKLAYALGGGGIMNAMMARPDLMKGMAAAAKEMSKLDGIPVLQITRMGAQGQVSQDFTAAASGQTEAAAQPSGPGAGEVAGEAAGGAAASAAGSKMGKIGRFGGLAGGLGGFGRKKTESSEQPQAAPAENGAPQSSALLMELVTEMTSFAQTADASKFEIPAGFKQVESPMAKQARK